MDRLKKGTTVNGRKYKNHIDGFNFLPHLTGERRKGRANGSSTSATTATCSASAG
jgi:arylsulfatase